MTTPSLILGGLRFQQQISNPSPQYNSSNSRNIHGNNRKDNSNDSSSNITTRRIPLLLLLLYPARPTLLLPGRCSRLLSLALDIRRIIKRTQPQLQMQHNRRRSNHINSNSKRRIGECRRRSHRRSTCPAVRQRTHRQVTRVLSMALAGYLGCWLRPSFLQTLPAAMLETKHCSTQGSSR